MALVLDLQKFTDRLDAVLVEHDLTDQRWQAPLPTGTNRWAIRDEDNERANGLMVQWSTGGVSGGSCWEGSVNHAYTSDEPVAEMTCLDVVFEDLYPQFTFLAYRRLSCLIQEGSYTKYEYYGNSRDYRYQFLPLQAFYDFLLKEGLVEAPEPSCDSR